MKTQEIADFLSGELVGDAGANRGGFGSAVAATEEVRRGPTQGPGEG